MTKNEQVLLNKLKAGEDRAVEEWFQEYQPRLLGFVLTKVSSRDDAEELVQETFVNCLKHLPLFRGQSSIWTWMCSVARHEVADYYRKIYAKKALRTLPLLDFLAGIEFHDAHETADRVSSVLENMSDRSAELLKAKYIDNKSVKKIASEWGKSVKGIESELFRARKEFKQGWGAFNLVEI